MKSSFERIRWAHWENLAGPLLAEMLNSRHDAERFLEHPEPRVRIAAMEVLADHWKPDASLARRCRRLAFNDPNSKVRNVALIVFASCFAYTDDPAAGRILATIVRDERQPVKFRSTAYKGLFLLRGKSLLWDGLFAHPRTAFPFPKEVDWSFVDSFLDPSRTASAVDPDRAAMPHLSEEQFNALRLYQQALTALDFHRYQDCVKHASEALALVPYAAGTYWARGSAYIELGRLDDAIADLSRAVELNPSSEDSLRGRARAYRLKGAVDLAVKDERAAAVLSQQRRSRGRLT